LAATIDELAVAALPGRPGMWHRDVAAKSRLRPQTAYRAAWTPGNPVVIDRWITETEAARATYEARW
jgi:hypothetical protein